MSASKRWLWLAAILFVAVTTRFYALDDAGILSVDEGRYVLDGLSKYVEAKLCLEIVEAKVEERAGRDEFRLKPFLENTLPMMKRYHPFSPKLGFNYLTAAVMAFTGYDVMAATYVEALFGVLVVAALFLLVRAVRNERTALIAALLLTLSCYHLYFSRNAYPQCCSVFFVILAVWCHLKWYKQQEAAGGAIAGSAWLAGCGALAGISFWLNYQAAGALPFLPLLHLVTCLRRGTGCEKVMRFVGGGIAMTAGFLFIMALAEAASYPMILLYRSQGMRYPHSTFLELLWPRLIGQTGKPFNMSGIFLFFHFLLRLEGRGTLLAIMVLIIVGLWFIWTRSVQDKGFGRSESFNLPAVYLGVPCVIPCAVFSFKTMQGARMFTYVLPFFIALLAIVVDAAWRSERRRGVLRAVVAVALLMAGLSSVQQWREVFRIRSAYPEVVSFLGEERLDRTLAPWSSVFESYRIAAEWDGAWPPVAPLPGYEEAAYFVNDWQECYYLGYPDESAVIPEDARVVKTFEHEFGRLFLEVETFPSHGNTIDNIDWVRQRDLERSRKVLVYERK